MSSSSKMDLLHNTTEAAICVYDCFPVLATIDWLKEARLISTALALALAIFLALRTFTYLTTKADHWLRSHTQLLHHNDMLSAFLANKLFSPPSFFSPSSSNKDRGRATICCGPSRPVYDSTVRVVFEGEMTIYAWPSRGGVIVHDHADGVDFDFLGLNRHDPPVTRLLDQKDEDKFCERLLMLGATWYDSEARFQFLRRLAAEDSGYGSPFHAINRGRVAPPTRKENAYVCVGWPSSGGFWVKEWHRNLYRADGDGDSDEGGEDGKGDECDYIAADVGRLRLCRSMDERCEILKGRLEARWYGSLGEYEGTGCLDAWRWKERGEVGDLERRVFEPEREGMGKGDV